MPLSYSPEVNGTPYALSLSTLSHFWDSTLSA